MTGRLLTLCVALAPVTAMAEERSADVNSSEVRAPRAWYGWQIMLADIGVIAMLAGGGVATGNSRSYAFIPITGGVIYYAGGPLIHLAHGSGEGVRRSLLLRGLVPLGVALLTGGIGALAFRGGGEECNAACAVALTAGVGFGGGMLVAMIADWVQAREPVQISPQASSPSEPHWAPTVMLTPRGGSAGVIIRF